MMFSIHQDEQTNSDQEYLCTNTQSKRGLQRKDQRIQKLCRIVGWIEGGGAHPPKQSASVAIKGLTGRIKLIVMNPRVVGL